MEKLTVQPGQTLFDIAIQVYGTLDGVWKLLEDNQLIYDSTYYKTGVPMGEHIPVRNFTDVSMPLVPGQDVLFDPQWKGSDPVVLRKLHGAIPATAHAEMANEEAWADFYSPLNKEPWGTSPVLYSHKDVNVVSGDVVNGLLEPSGIINMSEYGEVWDKRYHYGNPDGLPVRWDYPFMHYNEQQPFEWLARELNYNYLQHMWLGEGSFDYAFAVLHYNKEGACAGMLELFAGKAPLTKYVCAFMSLMQYSDLVLDEDVFVLEDFAILKSTYISPGAVLNIGEAVGHILGEVAGGGILRLEQGTLPIGNYDAFFSVNGGTLTFGGNGGHFTILEGISEVNKLSFEGGGYNYRYFPDNSILIHGGLIISGGIPWQQFSRSVRLEGNLMLFSDCFWFNYYSGDNYFVFAGTEDQYITGDFSETADNRNSFRRLTVEKSSGVLYINSGSRVRIGGCGLQEGDFGELHLARGIIENNGGTIHLTSNAHFSGHNYKSFIRGLVEKTCLFGENILFPVGIGNEFLPVEILDTEPIHTPWPLGFNLEVGVKENDTPPSFDFEEVSKEMYWLESDVEVTMAIKLHWNHYIEDVSRVVVARIVGGCWESIGGTAYGDEKGGYVISPQIGLTHGEYFAIGINKLI